MAHTSGWFFLTSQNHWKWLWIYPHFTLFWGISEGQKKGQKQPAWSVRHILLVYSMVDGTQWEVSGPYRISWKKLWSNFLLIWAHLPVSWTLIKPLASFTRDTSSHDLYIIKFQFDFLSNGRRPDGQKPCKLKFQASNYNTSGDMNFFSSQNPYPHKHRWPLGQLS